MRRTISHLPAAIKHMPASKMSFSYSPLLIVPVTVVILMRWTGPKDSCAPVGKHGKKEAKLPHALEKGQPTLPELIRSIYDGYELPLGRQLPQKTNFTNDWKICRLPRWIFRTWPHRVSLIESVSIRHLEFSHQCVQSNFYLQANVISV